MIQFNLREGITDASNYNAWMFPGGEIHFKIKEHTTRYMNLQKLPVVHIIANLVNPNNIIFLAIVCDTIYKDWPYTKIHVTIPYMAYQQADRDFSIGECFSLSTITKILSILPVTKYSIFDPHSDVTPALISFHKQCEVIPNYKFICNIFNSLISSSTYRSTNYGLYPVGIDDKLTILSPDAGAYKKIFKLAQSIGFNGGIETANKFRNTNDGTLQVRLSCNDFGGKDVLIIDDICIGGGTFIALAKELKDKNIGKLYLAISHGIFSNRFTELSKYFNGIFTTNSWKDNDSIKQDIAWSTPKIDPGNKNPDFFVNCIELF
jgi:ribose-phosphate pyrophosphokinase